MGKLYLLIIFKTIGLVCGNYAEIFFDPGPGFEPGITVSETIVMPFHYPGIIKRLLNLLFPEQIIITDLSYF